MDPPLSSRRPTWPPWWSARWAPSADAIALRVPLRWLVRCRRLAGLLVVAVAPMGLVASGVLDGAGGLGGGLARWGPALVVWALGWPIIRAMGGHGLIADRGGIRWRGLWRDRRWAWGDLRPITAEGDALRLVDRRGAARLPLGRLVVADASALAARLDAARRAALWGAGPLRLVTDRLVLREWVTGDFAARDPFHVAPWATATQCTPRRPRWLRRRIFARRVADRAAPVRAVWALAIHRRGEARPIGEVSLFRSHLHDARRGQIGFALTPEARGQGLATEAAGALLSWGFDAAGLRVIDAAHLPENTPSRAVLRRLGFVDAPPPPGYARTVAGRAARWMTCRRADRVGGGVESCSDDLESEEVR